jgi:hypothetical protein
MISFSYNWRGGPLAFIGVGGLFVLVSLAMLAIFMNQYSQLQHYQAGHCTITDKQLIQQVDTQTQTQTINGHTTTTTTTTIDYRPNFQFTVQAANGRGYSAQGYDALNTATSDQAGEQAIVDQYAVGKTYPCWYNPANPSQAVLTRQFDWFVFLFPGIFLFIGGVFVIVGIINKRNKINDWSGTQFSIDF